MKIRIKSSKFSSTIEVGKRRILSATTITWSKSIGNMPQPTFIQFVQCTSFTLMKESTVNLRWRNLPFFKRIQKENFQYQYNSLEQFIFHMRKMAFTNALLTRSNRHLNKKFYFKSGCEYSKQWLAKNKTNSYLTTFKCVYWTFGQLGDNLHQDI